MTEPLVLLPGLYADARVFLPQIVALSRDRPVTVAPSLVAERVEEAASALLNGLPARFALAGQGLGGVVALELLRRAPERIIRLALIACTPLGETPQEAAAREPRIVAARAGRFEEMAKQELSMGWLAEGPQKADVMGKMLSMGRANGPEAYVRQVRMLQRRKDQQSTLRKIKQPVLVVCGADDAITPVKRHEFMAELIPYAKLAVLDGAAHVPSLEAPAALTEALRGWMTQPLVLR